MSDHQPWLEQLPAADRQRAHHIFTGLRELACDDPQGWAESEVRENIPQLARYRFLHALWPEMIDCWREGITSVPAARRAIDAGANPNDVAKLARAVAYETVFAMLTHLAGEQADDELPTWILTEVNHAGKPTGRSLDALHEDLLTLDPSGQDGQDLWT